MILPLVAAPHYENLGKNSYNVFRCMCISAGAGFEFPCTHACKAREIAESAVEWCGLHGGTVPAKDLVNKIAACGSWGKHKSNCERDLHRVVQTVGHALQVPISQIRVRLWDHKEAKEYWGALPVIWPDEVAKSIFSRGEDIFKHCFAPRPDELPSYWAHIERHCSWFASHPARDIDNVQKAKLLPFCLYGDEINAFKNVENGSICVMGFGSDVAYNNSALERYYLFTAFSEHHATDNTFDDIIRALVPRLQRMFTSTSFNWSKAGWAWTYGSTQGDLKYITDRFRLHNFRKNSFCNLCKCVKRHENISMTLADFRDGAAYRDTNVSHEDYVRATAAEERLWYCI